MALCARLASRRQEIEQTALTRVHAIADPIEAQDPQYADGLRQAVSIALDYGFAAIERGGQQAPPVPVSLIAQARLAARNGVNLDTVLRRYFAGYTLFGDFLVQEAEGDPELRGSELKRLLRAEAVFFDRLVVAVSEEYGREEKRRPQGTQERRAELVRRLLEGEPIDSSGLGYELEAHHLALIARGKGAPEAIQTLAKALDRNLLIVNAEEQTAWAWLGGRRGIEAERLKRQLTESWPPEITLALGERGQGLGGWSLTHRQAKAALSVALRSSRAIVRYADVALLAAVLQDELLATSLRQLYIDPLAEERDGGEVVRETLRAYFAAGQNVSSAAAELGVNRNTVTNRLRAVEERIGHPLASCGIDFAVALRLDGLSAQSG